LYLALVVTPVKIVFWRVSLVAFLIATYPADEQHECPVSYRTGSLQEAQIVLDSYPDFRYEGPVFGHDTSPQGIEVFRFANTVSGGYFFTGSVVERDLTIRDYPNMRYEGSSFRSTPASASGAQPVYRLANLRNGAYLYTISAEERDYAISLGHWRDEGLTFYVPKKYVPYVAPLVSSWSCATPIVGTAWLCTLSGTQLNDTISAEASNCTPAAMTRLGLATAIEIIFNCNPAAVGPVLLNVSHVDGSGVKVPLLAAQNHSALPPAPLVDSLACSPPTVGTTMTCTVIGRNLTVDVQAAASNCQPGIMVLAQPNSPTKLSFTCTPSSTGAISVSVKELSAGPNGANLVAPYSGTVRVSNTGAVLTDWVCNYPSLGKDFICEMTGLNLPTGIGITTTASVGGAFSEQSGGTGLFRRFTCTAATSGGFSLSRTKPNLVQAVNTRFDRFLDWSAGNPVIPSLAGPNTQCGPVLASTDIPVTTAAGEFKLAQSDCFVSLKLNASEWAALINSDGFSLDTLGYAQRFSKTFKDSFNFVMFVLDSPGLPPNFGYYGLYSSFGVRAPNRLRRQLGTMVLPYIVAPGNQLNPIDGGPILHELLHEWANNGALISPSDAGHWGFSSVGGQLGGWDGLAGVEDLSNGNWRAKGPRNTCLPGATAAQITQYCSPKASFGTFANGGNTIEYAPLELMLMGLIAPSSVPDIRVAYDGRYINYATGEFFASDWRTFTAASIMTSLGNNAPNLATSQKHFRIATIVLTQRDQLEVATVNALNQSLEKFSLDGPTSIGNFNPSICTYTTFIQPPRG
jgi:hypothetical protein